MVTSMADPIAAPAARRHGLLLLIIAGACSVLAGAFVLLWFKLPIWAPAWVVEHSPFLDPLMRAVDAGGSANRLLARERIRAWGTVVAPSLIDWIGDGNNRSNILSIEMLGEFKEPRAVGALLSQLEHPRKTKTHFDEVFKALGLIGDERAVRPLVRMLSNEQSIVIITALTGCPHSKVTDAILPLPSGRGTELKVFFELASRLQDPRVVPALDAAMRAPPTVRPGIMVSTTLMASYGEIAALCLAQAVHPAGVPTLVAAFTDPLEHVRCHAVLGIMRTHGRSLDPRLIPPWLAALDDQSAMVRQLAVMSCRFVKAAGAEAKLLAMLDDPDPGIRLYAVMGLGATWTSAAAIVRLAEKLKDQDEKVRGAAVASLAATKNIMVLEPLISALDGADDKLQRRILEAVIAKPFCEYPGAFPLLLQLLAVPRAYSHGVALRAFERLTLTDEQRRQFDAVMRDWQEEPKAEVK